MGKEIKNIHIIINPAAGKKEATLPVIDAAMKEAGIKWEALVPMRRRCDKVCEGCG